MAVALTILSSSSAIQAGPLNLEEQVQAFATCAGRLSALATRQRALHDPQSETTGRLTSDFETLLDATLPHAYENGIDAARPTQWRAAGWVEIAMLLSQQQTSDDLSRIARAEADMARRITTCERLILSG